VLIVVEHRHPAALAQFALDRKALRRLDVFQIDAAESRFEAAMMSTSRSGSRSLISMSNTSMPANFLNSTPLPSITGFAASGPIAPSPRTAVPLVMTATRLPRAVRLRACAGSAAIASQAAATPGV
jgi:hypothetical protein